MTNKKECILSELEEARKEIKTDHYQMSVGELISLYRDGDLKLDPTYQRLFRWKDENKTRFIESLILGIPVPPIFVAQKEDGKWDIVDGLQRISTILQLTGDLNNITPQSNEDEDDANTEICKPNEPEDDKGPWKLTKSKYIPSIEGSTWDELPSDVTRIIKRARMSVSIILTANSISSQYELFQRLNTGGIHLSHQEIRNCLIIMTDKNFYQAIEDHKNNPDFLDAIRQNQNKIKEEIGMELILRYLIAKNQSPKWHDLSKTTFPEFIDKETLNLISDGKFQIQKELDLMMEVIKRLNGATNGNTFIKYNMKKDNFHGPFSVSIFEVLLAGIATNWEKISPLPDNDILNLILNIQKEESFIHSTRAGTRVLNRFFKLNKLSLDYFGNL